MKLQSTELRRMLAAEYALGTLQGRARRRLEQMAAQQPELRAEILFWEERLGLLADEVKPVTPPETVWIGLQHRIGTGNTVPLRRPGATAPGKAEKTAGAPVWRIAAGLATAAAVVLVVLFNQRPGSLAPVGPVSQPAPVVAVTPVAPTPVAVSYVALLKMPDSDLQWTVSLTPTHGRMTLAAAGTHPAALNGRSAELWWLSPKGPVAIGVLPEGGNGSMPLPKEMAEAVEVKLAVSLEPPGGSPTGAPTGPVVSSALAVRTA